MSESDLGAFLRARRESVTPAEVGLPNGSRRRVPGLRRSELATLAGISVDYLTRIEQGRDRNPSPQIIAVLGDALRLSAEERVHLHRMAKAGSVCTGITPPTRSVRPTVRAVLDRLDPDPAVLLNRMGDVVAHTEGFARLADPVGLLDHRPPNLPRFVFTDERSRAAFPDWDRVADEQVANLWVAASLGDPYVTELVDELTEAAADRFTDRWRAPATLPNRSGVERWAHPGAGERRLAYETLQLPDADDLRLVVYLPARSTVDAA